MNIIPRFIRLRDAPNYFGMDKNRFNIEVRPYLIQIKIGSQGIAFDRVDMDAFAYQYKSRNGRPSEKKLWDVKNRQGSSNVESSGMSTSKSEENGFAKAVERATLQKPKNI
jgi:hypothetical protein